MDEERTYSLGQRIGACCSCCGCAWLVALFGLVGIGLLV